EKQIRKAAGLGRIDPSQRAEATPKDYAFHDLLVVGGGPSGLSAALTAADEGVRVLLVEQHPRLGGSLAWQRRNDPQAVEHLSSLVERVTTHANIEVRCGTLLAGCYADHWYALVDEHRLTKLRTKSLIVATGCSEQPAVFQNNDLPGVMLASAAQRLAHLYAVQPFKKCVVLAGNRDAYRAALDLQQAGVEIAAIVDLRIDGETSELGSQVEKSGITVYRHHAIYEAIAGSGNTTVQGVQVCPMDAQGELDPQLAKRIDCDGVAVSVGWMPVAGPLYQAGGRFSYDDSLEQLVPTELPNSIFSAGRVRGIFHLADRLADGQRAGLAAAAELGRTEQPVPEPCQHTGPPPSHPYPIFAHKKKKNFVEFDEDLHLVDFANAHQEGYDNIELLKRYTTVGMGPSQGKLANMNAIRILARLNGKSINETGTTTSRPFHHPVPLAHLAGRRFHPNRHTPMHAWHEQAGAAFVYAGSWLRPEYYPVAGKSREALILEEAQHVRDSVGLIDLGTLGKIQISGKDAAAFLERIYTGRFVDQKVGSIRYGLACDETGTIIDDGVVARLDENRFYVTATTGGAAAFFREMQRWALIWQMQVDLVNLTGQLTAMNLTGPKTREVLAPLTDIDLSNEAFGFGKIREGLVAGIPAKLIRVGFVGELGYEIHLPAAYGHSLWSELMEVGHSAGIRPFGIEAQRLLRLEKGHSIVSIDTDALTNPYEANLAWVVEEKKEFFVGQRSLAILQRKKLTRQLVGFELPSSHNGPLPEECHLIVEQGEIVGRVTSIAHRSTLGKTLGLAFVRPDMAEPGTPLTIRVDQGKLVPAAVTPLPFYDPDNLRQK
ncbi:MAG: FAD-dependent oxidoreductase, partial [Planctomycetes bacterium]|nr:FAD-dependent oxidoreductase [Planctomycetota bacterium]